MSGQVLAQALEKAERALPVFIEVELLGAHQAIDPLPANLTRGHVVDQARKIVGQRSAAAGVLAISGEPAAPCNSGEFAHLTIISASSSRRSSDGSASGRVECRPAPVLAVAASAKTNLVLVDIADGDDARQDGGIARDMVEELIARQAAGAPRRQIERGFGERQRIAARRKARHQPAASSASISTGRNGAEAGMLKTCCTTRRHGRIIHA